MFLQPPSMLIKIKCSNMYYKILYIYLYKSYKLNEFVYTTVDNSGEH